MRELKLNLAQKHAAVTSFSAAIAAFLVLALITLLLFILVTGSSFFWPQNILELKYRSAQTSQLETSFAQQIATSVKGDQKRLHFRATIDEDMLLTELMLLQNNVVSARLAEQARLISLTDSSVLI